MSKFWIAAGLLAAVVAGALWNQQHVLSIGGEVLHLLEQAGNALEVEADDRAQAAVKEAVTLWESKSGYLNAVLRHSEIDQVCLALDEALWYLENGALLEFYTTASRIEHWILILCDMEGFRLSNVL